MFRSCLPAALLAAGLALPLSASAADSCERYGEDLAAMRSADQALRKRVDHLDVESRAQLKLREHIRLVERVNTERLKALLENCGWPSKTTHGKAAVSDAWLLVGHAKRDLAFQKRVLALVEQAAAASGERLDASFAYLDDSIAVAEKRLQRYGTQLLPRDDNYCVLEFSPLDNLERVKARRAEIGLPTLETYKRYVLDMRRCPSPPPSRIEAGDEPWLKLDKAPQPRITRK